MSPLPSEAFIPQIVLSVDERRKFVDARDRLFTFCTPAEQRCLIGLASWYAARRHRLLKTPNILSECYSTERNRRHLPWMDIQPRVSVRVMAAVWKKIDNVERWYGDRLQDVLIAKLEGMRRRDGDDLVMSIANYLRALPLRLRADTPAPLAQRLEKLADQCFMSPHIDPQKRIDSLIRFVRGAPREFDDRQVRADIWKALLAVAEQDIAAGLQLIDEHWQSREEPTILSWLSLHWAPELAARLARLFHAHRPAFAATMMEKSIQASVNMLEKLNGPDRNALQQLIDASCHTLASWVASMAPDNTSVKLEATRLLFCHGDPMHAYWPSLGTAAFDVLRNLNNTALCQHFNVLAQVAVYADSGSALEAEALELFEACARQGLAVSEEWTVESQRILMAIAYASTILENKVLSPRNRRIPTHAGHPLQRVLERCVQAAVDRGMARAPQEALGHLVVFIDSHFNETITRKLHQAFRDRFEDHARAFPAGAGVALRSIIRSRAFRQVTDEAYRKALYQETFDLLIPVLDRISPADATVARSGIGYNFRRDYV